MFTQAPTMSSIEPLESRIAPAVVITNPLPDVTAGIGSKTVSFDLSQLTAAASSSAYHTKVKFITNYDTDPGIAFVPGEITIELYDDLAPLTVQNFLAYVNAANASGDYDGTLFHRAVNGFILQGGGYEAATPTAHIPVFPSVHNEADVVNRSNIAGTVAMAKVDGNPNSATSEWFVNLKDNNTGAAGAGNLDAQNGGFTVFGKVLDDGLALATAITNLPKTDVGLGSITPTQNGMPIRVTDAVVLPPTPESTTGVTYTVESVAPVGVTPAGLVSATITGSQLNVGWTGTQSGLATVTIKASDATSSATDTFSVEVRPNFAGELASDTLPGWLLPGDAGTVKVNVSNSGGSSGGGTVIAYLSKVDVTKNSFGQITNFTESNPASTISLAGSASFQLTNGTTQQVSIPLKLSGTPFAADETYYRLITEVVPTDTALAKEELFSDDNRSTANSLHDAVNKFGTLTDSNFGTRVAVFKYAGESTNAKPATVTWAIKGPGVGTIGFDAQGKDVSLSVQGTTFKSVVAPTLTKNSARLTLSSIDFADAVGPVNFGFVDLSGPLSASGGLRTLTLGSVSGQSLFSIGAALSDEKVKATLTFGAVQNVSIESSQPITSLTVASWLDNDATSDVVSAPSLGKLLVKGTGNFEADLTLSDSTVPLTSITIGGFLKNGAIKAAGDIGKVKLGGIDKGSVFAGVTARPATFIGAEAHKIGSFSIAGIKGVTTPLFIDSQVAAQTIGVIQVKGVSAAPSPTASGFVAEAIRSYVRPGVLAKTNLTADYDDVVDGANVGYLVKILAPPV